MASLVKKTASCITMLTQFEQAGQIVTTPQPADIIFMKFKTNNRRTNHVGLVAGVRGNTITTIEGNTSVNSDDNGGSVMTRERSKNIVAYARPLYSSEQQKQKLLNLAKNEIGEKEYPPNSNNVKYNTWYYGHPVSGPAYPWCAVFVSWLFNQLGGGSMAPVNPPICRATIRKGSKGPDVKLLQEILISRGYILKVDGDFGPVTETYVKQFQKSRGLVPDGIVGPLTWNQLL